MCVAVSSSLSPEDLLEYGANRFSQNREDGVIARLFELIGTDTRVACEFGAWDGIHFSNTRALLLDGWSGVMIEADPAKYEQLVKTYADRDDVWCINAMVGTGENSLPELLRRGGAPTDLDLLSIDIDGLDYEVFETMEVRPRVVVVEVNAGHPPDRTEVVPREVAADNVGQPLARFVELGQRLGYRFVAYTGNAIFVREDIGAGPSAIAPVEAYDRFLNQLSGEEKRWLFRVNRGLAPPFHRYRNARLSSRSLGIPAHEAARLMATGLVTRLLRRG
jgi:hypothetical protein